MASNQPTYGSLPEFDIKNYNWKNYSRRLKYYFQANDITSEDKQKAILLTVLGDEALSILCSLTSPDDPEKLSLDDLISKLSNHFEPPSNETVDCFNFYTRQQNVNESVTEYSVVLRKLAQKCEFVDMDKQLRVRLVCGIRDEILRKRLLTVKKLTFSSALEIALAHEAAEKNASEIGNSIVKPTSGRPQSSTALVEKQNSPSSATRQGSVKQLHGKPDKKIPCFRCTELHDPQTCPFRTFTCNYCKKLGHIVRACKTRKTRKDSSAQNCISDRNVEQEVSQNVAMEQHLFNVSKSENDNIRPIVVDVTLNNVLHQMEIDSGASYSVISMATYRNLWPNNAPPLTGSNIQLHLWDQQPVRVSGSFKVDVTLNYKSAEQLTLLVVDKGGRSLLGRNWFTPLQIQIEGLNTLNMESEEIARRFPSLFDATLGKVTGPPVHIDIVKDATPIFRRPRPVPLPLQDRITSALNALVENGTLEPTQHSQWATPIVPVVKPDGSIRVCMDYRSTVNPYLQANVYPLPQIPDVLLSISGATVFSTLDLAQAYLQLPLDEESAKLLTINTHKGLFRVKRLPFGLSSSPSIFQRFMESLLTGISGIAIYLDDVVVAGRTDEEHDQRLDEVLRRLEKRGLRLQKGKCSFRKQSIKFLGFLVDSKGIHPTGEKVAAIRDAPPPKNKGELQAFLGLINFYNSFLKNKATVAEPLHRLLDKGASWNFGPEQLKAFNEMKALISTEDVLVHYSPTKELILACDASPYGVGSVLSHVEEGGYEKPIAFASRTLTPTERNYAQIDREGLSIIFGVKKFHRYIAGRHVIIVTDHKPLLGVLGNDRPIPQMLSPRMLRWSLLLAGYDYELKYRPGPKMSNADALSRLPCETENSSSEAVIEEHSILLLEAPNPPVNAEEVKTCTLRDPILAKVRDWVMHGMDPSLGREPALRPYVQKLQELSVVKDCLTWSHRVIIPKELRSRILQELHIGHPGIVRMKMLARSYVWWPGLDRDIETLVNTCEPCQQSRHLPPKEHPNRWERPEKVWSRLHVDILGPQNSQKFLLVVDASTKWLEVEPISSATTAAVTAALRKIFATHGFPEVLVSDNGKCFISADFADFLAARGIHQILIPPYHPSSNGLAERYVQTTKDALKRVCGDKKWKVKLPDFLFHHRITPNTATRKSPAELLLGRRPRTTLDLCHPERVAKTPEARPQNASRRFEIDQPVYMLNFIKNQEKWIPARITQRLGDRVYRVRAIDGSIHTRHVDQLRRRHQLIECIVPNP